MIKRFLPSKKINFPIILCLLLILIIIDGRVFKTTITGEIGCKDYVDEYYSLTQNLIIPDNLAVMPWETVIKDGNEFDVMQYFKPLDHLSLEPGYVLDYVYHKNMSSGIPVLYARAIDQTPYLTFDQYQHAFNLSDQAQQENKLHHGYLDHIKIDGTPEGYIQFVLLSETADQFYLWWHANYNDYRLLCDTIDAINILSILENGDSLPGDNEFRKKSIAQSKETIRNFNLTPTIQFTKDGAVVSVVYFSLWEGFNRTAYIVSLDFPHQIIQGDTINILEYQSGIIFRYR